MYQPSADDDSDTETENEPSQQVNKSAMSEDEINRKLNEINMDGKINKSPFIKKMEPDVHNPNPQSGLKMETDTDIPLFVDQT